MKVMSRKFTQQEDDFIRANYLTIPAKRIGLLLGRAESSARQRMLLLGLTVPKEVSDKFKSQSQFKKGHVPNNKGKQMPPELREKVSRTWFKKGSRPHNTAEGDGAISVRTDTKSKRKYKYIRLSLGKWDLLHVHEWQKVNGPLPDGKCLRFRDGDTMNCDLSNLELIDRAENMARNTIQRYPKELQLTIKRISKLKKKIKCQETN